MQEKGDSLVLVESHDAIELVPRWEVQGWWFFVAAGLILVVTGLVILLRRKKSVFDPLKRKREAYSAAKKQLSAIDGESVRAIAGMVSLVLREYLATSMDDPALFETHEEFIGRHESLADLSGETRAEVSRFFGRLAEVKYGKEDQDVDQQQRQLVDEGTELLERIHNS